MRTLALIALLTASLTAMAGNVQLRQDAPDRHIVVKGDTLWDISAQFLKSPWKWPEIWQDNRDHIKNPHWIYPGDIIYLVQTPNGPRLVVNGMKTVKLTPSVHSEPIEEAVTPIPSIPYSSIEAFVRRPILADEETLEAAPTIIGAENENGLMTLGDTIYAVGAKSDTTKWNIVRIGDELVDPDTGEKLARDVTYIGDAVTTAGGEPATLRVTAVTQEVEPGDKLLPMENIQGVDLTPHVPKDTVESKIIAIIGGTQATSKYSTVIIDKGESNGMRLGDVLAVYRTGRSVGNADYSKWQAYDPKSGYLDGSKERREQLEVKGEPVNVKLPDIVVGHILLYRVFNRVAYGLVMDSSMPVNKLDAVRNPEP